jgi:hypothetical protein
METITEIWKEYEISNIYTCKEIILSNKLLCTFCEEKAIDSTIEIINSRYDIVFNKIFVLKSDDNEQYIITYNIDPFNTSGGLIENTISVHRKKDSNTLYTINALNLLIRTLNEGIFDINYKINWSDYQNSILLANDNQFKKLNTKVFKILYL